MSILSNFLKLKPPYWSDSDYTSSRFTLCKLNDADHMKMKTNLQIRFPYLNVTKIERVQHPYAYAKYLVRKEHLRTQDGKAPKVRFDIFKHLLDFKEALYRSPSSICKYWIAAKCETFWTTIVTIVEGKLWIYLRQPRNMKVALLLLKCLTATLI